MATKTATIKWSPFSKKHRDYIRASLSNWFMVAEGAIRSGKTIDHCIIASMYLETCPDKIHHASGSTIANAKMNIGDCNGYGLQHIFRGRCKWGLYQGNEALYIRTQTGTKIVVFAGGGKSDSYKKILGNSFFGSYGAPNVFPWASVDCAERTTCTGRQALRLLR